MGSDKKEPVEIVRHKVRVRPYNYQPTKAELEADVSVEASPEDIRDALMRSVTVEAS